MCDFCCLLDFEFCARDIGICEPVVDRNLGILVDCVKILGSILLGFPIIIAICKCLIINRCCKKCFRDELGGTSCYELFFRFLCCLKCTSFSETFPISNDIIIDTDIGRGLIYYVLCCCFCPKIISSKFDKGSKVKHDDEDDGVELEEGEGEEGEEGEEDDADN